MSEKISLYNPVNDSGQEWSDAENRKIAVEAVLEILKAQALGGSTVTGDFDFISNYADKIQNALIKTDPNQS